MRESYCAYMRDRSHICGTPATIAKEICLEKDDPVIKTCASMFRQLAEEKDGNVDWPITVIVCKQKGLLFETLGEFRYGKDEI